MKGCRGWWIILLCACAPARTAVLVETIQVEMQRTPQIVPVTGSVERVGSIAWFAGELAEPHAARARLGQRLHVRVAASGERCLGQIRELIPSQGGVRLRLELECRAPIPPTTTGVAEWIAGERFGIFVPREALQSNQDGAWIWIVQAGVARRQTVRLGSAYLGAVEIVAGLDGGEQVIIAADRKLTERQLIRTH